MNNTKTNRIGKTLVGISLTLSIAFSGSMFIAPEAAHAAVASSSTVFSDTNRDGTLNDVSIYMGNAAYLQSWNRRNHFKFRGQYMGQNLRVGTPRATSD